MQSQKISPLVSIDCLARISWRIRKIKVFSFTLESKIRSTPFDSVAKPEVSVKYYLERFQRYTEMDENLFICALILIDRLCEKSRILLTEFNVHRIIAVSCITVIKLMEDCIYKDRYYTEVAGVDLCEFIALENEFLDGIGFDLCISTGLFNKYKDFVHKRVKKI